MNTYLQTAEELTLATSTLLHHQITHHNTRVIEIRFCPTLHTRESLTDRAATHAVSTAYLSTVTGLPRKVRGGIILVALRSHPPFHIARIAELTKLFLNNGVIGMDLAGDESTYPLSIHAPMLRAAAKELPLTIHAGETGPLRAENVRLAVEIGARRIGHAIVLADDASDDLGALLRENDVCVEVCLTANCTGGGKVAAERFDLHPLRDMVRRGVRVAGLSCDNLLLSGTESCVPDPAEEIVRAKLGCGLSWAEIRCVLINGAAASFDGMGSAEEVKAFLTEFTAEVDHVLKLVLSVP